MTDNVFTGTLNPTQSINQQVCRDAARRASLSATEPGTCYNY